MNPMKQYPRLKPYLTLLAMLNLLVVTYLFFLFLEKLIRRKKIWGDIFRALSSNEFRKADEAKLIWGDIVRVLSSSEF